MTRIRGTAAVLAALGLALGSSAAAQSTADQPASETAPSGGMSGGSATGALSTISEDDLRSYVQVRQQIERRDPELADALRSDDLSGHEQEIQSVLATAGSQMSVQEFEQVHRQAQTDPDLQARIAAIESEMGTSGTPGTSGTRGPGEGAPLPSGGLGTGPGAGSGQTQPGAQQPGLGTGAPTTGGQEGGDGSGSSR